MRFNLLGAEERPGFFKVGTIGGQIECFENGYDTAGSFRDRTILNEQGLPDCIGLLAFRHLPVALGRNIRRAEQFRFQIVIGQQFVDAPQPDAAKLGGEQVSVNVDKLVWSRVLLPRWTGSGPRSNRSSPSCRLARCSFHSFLRFRSEACSSRSSHVKPHAIIDTQDTKMARALAVLPISARQQRIGEVCTCPDARCQIKRVKRVF